MINGNDLKNNNNNDKDDFEGLQQKIITAASFKTAEKARMIFSSSYHITYKRIQRKTQFKSVF